MPTDPNMADEIAKAQVAVPTEDTIFGKISRGEIPCQFIYEDDKVVVYLTHGIANDKHFHVRKMYFC